MERESRLAGQAGVGGVLLDRKAFFLLLFTCARGENKEWGCHWLVAVRQETLDD